MPRRCVAGGCSAFSEVEKGLVLHAIKKWVDFVQQKRAKREPTRNSSLCSRHFTEDDFIHHFTFANKTSESPSSQDLNEMNWALMYSQLFLPKW